MYLLTAEKGKCRFHFNWAAQGEEEGRRASHDRGRDLHG